MNKNSSMPRTKKPKDSDLCPCGSLNEYSNCCSNKDKKYLSFGKNYNGQEILLDDTANSIIYSKMTRFAIDILKKSENENGLSVNYGVQELEKLYSMFDSGIQQLAQYISCQKRCTECCHTHLNTTAIEAELIRRYVNKNFNQNEILEFYNIAKRIEGEIPEYITLEEADEKTKDKILDDYYLKRIPCLFLSSDGDCLIYEVRPANCRNFISFSDTDRCKREYNDARRARISIMNGMLIITDQLSININRFKKLKLTSPKDDLLSIHKSLPNWFINGFEDINRRI